ncbi:MAG: thioesterase family protein [Gemmataceae bacterium]|nr:thioesterase family protein [Gemmata sp.]MDW8196855.1 thioesterase family protein [Gemmataceae bacterium]
MELAALDLAALPLTHRAVVPAAYLDDMGHMNVMWYTHLFSGGTGGLYELIGLTRAYWAAHQAGSFALEQHLRYLKEVRVGQQVTIRSRVLGRSAKRIHLMHFMTLDDAARIAATCETVATHVDLTIRRSSPWPEAIAAAIDRLLAEHARLPWVAPVCGAMKA